MGKYDLSRLPSDEPSQPLPTHEPQTYAGREAIGTIDDAVRAAANAATFGMADRFAGGMNYLTGQTDATSPGSAIDEEVRASEAARKRSPYASVAGDVGGSLSNPVLGAPRMAARMAGTRFLPDWLTRGAAYGGAGAVVGGVQGAGNTYTGNPIDYLVNAGEGAKMGGALGFGAGAMFAPRGGMRSTAPTPTTPQLYGEKNANYRALENSVAPYNPNALAAAGDDLEALLQARRYRPDRSPESFRAVDEMRNPPTTAPYGRGAIVYPGDIESIRQGPRRNLNPRNPMDATDIASSQHVFDALDNFITNPPPGAVLPGGEPAARAAAAMAERARGNYGAYKRGQTIDDIINNAQNQAGSTHSGLNLENEFRKALKTNLKQKEGESVFSSKYFNDPETQALTDYARGTTGQNVQRYVGNYLGGGGGIGAPLVGGLATQYFRDNPTEGAIAGGLVQAGGLATRVLGNRGAARRMDTIGDMVRQRSPMYRDAAVGAPMAPPPGGGVPSRARNAITFEMLARQAAEDEGR
jgi:hypothetical protein